jgi:ATP citrate (pro-S)-lyase
MRELGTSLDIDIHVYGPEMHITGIVPLAINSLFGSTMVEPPKIKVDKSFEPRIDFSKYIINETNTKQTSILEMTDPKKIMENLKEFIGDYDINQKYFTFTNETQAFVYGLQPKAVQGMLDFDFMCKRTIPSVACIIYPFGENRHEKFYWGTTEILIPIINTPQQAIKKFDKAKVFINFASFRRFFL